MATTVAPVAPVAPVAVTQTVPAVPTTLVTAVAPAASNAMHFNETALSNIINKVLSSYSVEGDGASSIITDLVAEIKSHAAELVVSAPAVRLTLQPKALTRPTAPAVAPTSHGDSGGKKCNYYAILLKQSSAVMKDESTPDYTADFKWYMVDDRSLKDNQKVHYNKLVSIPELHADFKGLRELLVTLKKYYPNQTNMVYTSVVWNFFMNETQRNAFATANGGNERKPRN